MFDLNEISKKFTTNVLEDILTKYHPDKTHIKLTTWELEDASSKGDNYLSVVRKITIKGTANQNDEPIEAKIVVKSLPTNLGRRSTFRSVDFFRNEVLFYTEIIPKLHEFLSKKGQMDLISIPRCLGALADGRNDYLILQDLSPLDYKPASRETIIDIDKIILIMKTMARFHAISLAYKDQREEEFVNLAGRLKETYFSYDHWDWYKRFHKTLIEVAEDALKQEYPNSKALKQFNAYKYGEMYSKCCDFCDPRDNKSSASLVINQGDCWAPNFMIRDVGGQQQVAMLDFQLARYASPVLDISFFIYSCTDHELRRDHYDDILSVYHQEVKYAIAKLGSNPDSIFSWHKFMEEVKRYSVFGMIFAMESIPFSLLDSNDAFDLDKIQGDKQINIADVWTLSPIKTKNGRRRLADVIVHAYEKHYL